MQTKDLYPWATGYLQGSIERAIKRLELGCGPQCVIEHLHEDLGRVTKALERNQNEAAS